MISVCQGLAVQRNRLLEEFRQLCNITKNYIQFEEIEQNEELLCQFILDPTSLNLKTRVSLSDPLVPHFYKLSRDFCFLLDKTRVGLLKQMEEATKNNSC